MKVKAVNYAHGGLSLEIIGETPVEAALLRQIWLHGGMSTGNGNTECQNGGSQGFYLDTEKKEKDNG